MEHKDIKLGMKVIPINKSPDGRTQGLHTSAVWNQAKAIRQPYLYVTMKRPNSDYSEITLSLNYRKNDGDYFLSSDVIKYKKD